MAEILRGTPKDKAAFGEQMRAIYARFPDALVVGRFGRAAIMAAYGHPVKPIDLRLSAEEVAAKMLPGPPTQMDLLRDIDIVGAPDSIFEVPAAASPHWLDGGVGAYIFRDPGRSDRVILQGIGFGGRRDDGFLEIGSSELLTGVVRDLDGIPVRTPLVGVQQQIEHIIGVDHPLARPEKYQASVAEFDGFADGLRQTARLEFLPESVMAPLAELARRNVL